MIFSAIISAVLAVSNGIAYINDGSPASLACSAVMVTNMVWCVVLEIIL